MGIGSLGFSEMVVIFLIILIFFGPRRFPEIARSLGHAMREFRRSLNQIQRELEDADPRTVMPGRDWSLRGSARQAADAPVATPGPRDRGDAASVTDPARPRRGPDTSDERTGAGQPSAEEQIPMFGEATDPAGEGARGEEGGAPPPEPGEDVNARGRESG